MTAENVLLTGGSAGIGAAPATRLLDAGHRMLSLDRKPAERPHGNFRSMQVACPIPRRRDASPPNARRAIPPPS